MATSPSPSSGNETTGFSNVTINTLSIEADEAALESMIACLIFHGLAVLYGILISIYRSRLQNRNNRRYGSAEWFLVGINLFPTFVTVGMCLRIGYLLFEVLITSFVVTVGALYIWTFLLALYLLGTLLYIQALLLLTTFLRHLRKRRASWSLKLGHSGTGSTDGADDTKMSRRDRGRVAINIGICSILVLLVVEDIMIGSGDAGTATKLMLYSRLFISFLWVCTLIETLRQCIKFSLHSSARLPQAQRRMLGCITADAVFAVVATGVYVFVGLYLYGSVSVDSFSVDGNELQVAKVRIYYWSPWLNYVLGETFPLLVLVSLMGHQRAAVHLCCKRLGGCWYSGCCCHCCATVGKGVDEAVPEDPDVELDSLRQTRSSTPAAVDSSKLDGARTQAGLTQQHSVVTSGRGSVIVVVGNAFI